MGKAGGTEVVSVSKIKHQSGKTALVILYNTYMVKDGEKVSHLQKAYTFSCEDNVYSFVYTPHNDKDIDKFDSSFDSINIPEPEIKSIVSKIKEACIVAVFFLLIILGIVRFLRKASLKRRLYVISVPHLLYPVCRHPPAYHTRRNTSGIRPL